MTIKVSLLFKCFISLSFMLNLFFLNLVYADGSLSANGSLAADGSKYKEFIKPGALKPYNQNNRQLNIIKKFSGSNTQANKFRVKAAYMAIESGKCDYVNSSDVVGEKFLQYEVICKNGAIIYLTEKEIINNSVNSDSVIMEKEKALPRSIAKSRCEQLINNYAFNQNVTKQQLAIDRYQISTWITDLGVTKVIMGFTMDKATFKAKKYTAQCIFSHNQKDTFNVSW